jgi:hypothetical protein
VIPVLQLGHLTGPSRHAVEHLESHSLSALALNCARNIWRMLCDGESLKRLPKHLGPRPVQSNLSSQSLLSRPSSSPSPLTDNPAVDYRTSRYGRTTVVTRQTFAAAYRDSRLSLFARSPSRSASSATSRPILFRNLKQSATVLAAE